MAYSHRELREIELEINCKFFVPQIPREGACTTRIGTCVDIENDFKLRLYDKNFCLKMCKSRIPKPIPVKPTKIKESKRKYKKKVEKRRYDL